MTSAALPKPRVMGIVNVTPDSFSDGGRFMGVEAAVAHALALQAEGADVLDIGAESTRPGFAPVPLAEELARLLPVLDGLAGRAAVPVSVDTSKAAVAREALARGAAWINDVWGLQGDPAMADAAAAGGAAAVVVMHNRATVDEALDVADDLERFFARSLAIADRAGLPRERLILDPGVGFGKTPRQQLQAIAALPRLAGFGLPILVGVSRKGFLGALTGAPVGKRVVESVAANLAAWRLGASLFRVHEVAAHVAALTVFAAATTGRGPAA